MIKILVADDDSIVRSTFKNIIDWNAYDFFLCEAACNGLEALETVRKERVDIVITDIKMPVMDGLSFIESVKKEFPDIKIIVLSAFDEFSFVNQAYQLGASDYLLKMEVEHDSLLKLLLRVSDELKKDMESKKSSKEKEEAALHMEKAFFRSKKLLQQKILKELIYGSFTKELQKKMEMEDIYISPCCGMVIVIKLNNYYTVEKELFEEERELFLYAIDNIFEECLNDYKAVYGFFNLPHEYVIIFPNTLSENESSGILLHLYSKLQASARKSFDIIISGGYSKIIFDKNMNNKAYKNAYKKAIAACEYSFVAGRKRFVSSDEIDFNPIAAKLNISEKIRIFRECLSSMNGKAVFDVITKVQVDEKEVTINNIESVRELFNSYYHEISNMAYNFSPHMKELLAQYKKIIFDAGCLSDLNNWISQVLCEFADFFGGNNLINEAKSFIQEHYNEQISLPWLAEHLQVSESHLSRFFKLSTGLSFTQYLINTRIEAAINLMKNSNLKVYEIAEKVGYTNVEHFSRMFKRMTGKTPKEYMK